MTRRQRRFPAQYRAFAGFIAVSAAFVAVFVALTLSAFHHPAPHGLPVGIAGPPAVTGQVERAADSAAPGAFRFRSYPSAASATAGIARRDVDGALFSLAVAAPTAALARVWPPLTALAVLAFIVAGIPVSGGPANLAGTHHYLTARRKPDTDRYAAFGATANPPATSTQSRPGRARGGGSGRGGPRRARPGRTLALGNSGGNVYVYSVPATYTNLNQDISYRRVFAASTRSIFGVEFLSNDSVVAGGSDGVVRFWNLPAGTFTSTIPAQTLATHWGAIAGLSYSARLGLLATASPSGTRVWETNPRPGGGEHLPDLEGPGAAQPVEGVPPGHPVRPGLRVTLAFH
jgi:hypothetical protein